MLDDIKVRKVFVPCGFRVCTNHPSPVTSRRCPVSCAQFDHLIFYAEQYPRHRFAKAHGIQPIPSFPNGASETDFSRVADGSLREKLGIAKDDFLFLTVGTPVNAKDTWK